MPNVMDAMERFNRRTISFSSKQDVMNEVAEILQGATLEEDEESIASDDILRDLGLLGSQKTPSSRPSLLPEVKERESEHSISNFESIIHLLKGNIGMGVLTLPMAIRNAGLLFGILGLGFIAFICVYCMRMLVNAAHKACARRPNVTYLDYADTGEAAFLDAGGVWSGWSSILRQVINIFLCLMQIGSMAVYALFIAQNLQPIFEHYGGEVFQNLGNRVYIAMVLPFMIALCSIRNLRYLSPFSILANIIQEGPTGYYNGKIIIYRYVNLV